REGGTQTFDERILLAMRKPDNLAEPVGPAWLHEAGRDVTALGGVAFLTLLTAAVLGFLVICRRRGAVCLVLIAVGGGELLRLGRRPGLGRAVLAGGTLSATPLRRGALARMTAPEAAACPSPKNRRPLPRRRPPSGPAARCGRSWPGWSSPAPSATRSFARAGR